MGIPIDGKIILWWSLYWNSSQGFVKGGSILTHPLYQILGSISASAAAAAPSSQPPSSSPRCWWNEADITVCVSGYPRPLSSVEQRKHNRPGIAGRCCCGSLLSSWWADPIIMYTEVAEQGGYGRYTEIHASHHHWSIGSIHCVCPFISCGWVG